MERDAREEGNAGTNAKVAKTGEVAFSPLVFILVEGLLISKRNSDFSFFVHGFDVEGLYVSI